MNFTQIRIQTCKLPIEFKVDQQVKTSLHCDEYREIYNPEIDFYMKTCVANLNQIEVKCAK